ncbi:efflux RND transporter periplasmic adaptor subunit [Aliiglaciecola litoralis]|uniref:Efflux RND transporter periplasmic adaptor subunit n=1 Tax=Aliiglaciecola litoralis TaxID=582857 RepID=A0ABN1LCD7_9ALTE
MKSVLTLMGGVTLGASATFLAYTFLISPTDNHTSSTSTDSNEPLYWVAPMDPNFKRDKPGKSPMGMDLVPVYAQPDNAIQSPGTVTINPNVENNLGVRTAQVERKALHVPIRTVGYVQYNEDTLVHIHPRVEGWIEILHVKAAGEYVQKGDPLYALYSPQLVNAQEEYLLAIKRSNTNLIEAAKSRLKALQMPASAVQQLSQSGKVQQTIVFTSPQTGFIDNLNIREGFFVKPGTTIMSIGALDQVWVEAEVFERQSSLIKQGLPVSMTLDYVPGQKWQGKVDYVYPTLDSLTRTLKVRLRFDNKDYLLKPNMFAQVTIHSDLAAESLVVPTESVIRTGTQDRVVLALGEGQFKSVAVTVGNIANEYTTILSGLEEGDRVVSSSQFLLDSESSISSDFKRMGSDDEVMDHATMQDDEVSRATVTGVINSVDVSARMVNISREAIEKWGRGPATMDFVIAEDLDLGLFKAQSSIHFTFEIHDGDFVIVNLTTRSTDDSNMTEHQMHEGKHP